ncbi:MAG: DUF4091 domain-containing protein [Ruminococcaceae bacterium]|nr:DUF4091 domain-containing protein [Oscillospiraceae bacterium]
MAALTMLSAATGIGADGDNTALHAEAKTDRVLGDIDGSGAVDIDDAITLFRYSMLPEFYPVDYPGTLDFQKDGSLDIRDARVLFCHSMLPDKYPIEWGWEQEVVNPDLCDCGNIRWDKSDGKVGAIRLDAFQSVASGANYNTSIENSKVTVNEHMGLFYFLGWVGLDFSDFELAWRIGTDNPIQYSTRDISAFVREPAVYAAAQAEGFSNATGISAQFSMDSFSSGDAIHFFLKDKTDNTVYCFERLEISKSYPEMLEKYELGKDSDMDMSPYDPISRHESVTAPHDDKSVKLWFDHLTEKVARYDTSDKDSGSTSYTIQMGKNEIEGCQFFLYSPTPKKVEIKVSDFENSSGEKLNTEVGVEFYIEDAYLPYLGYSKELVYPDAVVPYDSYVSFSTRTEPGVFGNGAGLTIADGPYICLGPFSANPNDLENYPFRDSIRGFVLQAETKKDTTPGAYSATVEVYDADTGKCIKMAKVYTYVYDVTLSDETALDTVFNLWDINSVYQHHYKNHPDMTQYSSTDIVRAIANFFLKNRMTLSSGVGFMNTMGLEWFENPRVTSLRVMTKNQYDSLKNNPILAEKMFYYGQDEPGVPRGWRSITWPDGVSETVYDDTGLLSILAVGKEADQLKNVWGWKDYRLLIPFERTMNLTDFDFNSFAALDTAPDWAVQYAARLKNDSVGFFSDYVNVWTYVFTGATPAELEPVITDERYMQDAQQNALFGELQTRLEGFRSKGDELWNYVACEPQYYAPYQNIFLFSDGTEGRTMFWSTYMLNGTGFLYWNVSYYNAVGNNTYTLRCPFSSTGPGDGILIYPGSAYGQLDPIPSIRLLNMRDGIEEYQLLTMLEEAYGEEYTDELVSHIVTSTVTFTRDDDMVYNVHSYLMRALEEAEK